MERVADLEGNDRYGMGIGWWYVADEDSVDRWGIGFVQDSDRVLV